MNFPRLLLLLSSFVAGLPAQQTNPTPPVPTPRPWIDPVLEPGQQKPGTAEATPVPQGFPLFPPSFPGPGLYPPPAGFGQPPTGAGTNLPPLVPEAPNWPSWLQARAQHQLPYAVDRAVLVRHADRVWVQPPGEDAAVPMYYFENVQSVAAGTWIEIRSRGEFQLLLQGGSRIYAYGPSRLQLVALDDKSVQVQVEGLSRLQLVCRGRAHVVRLPDGSELRVAAVDEPQPPVELQLLRHDEPGWVAGRATLAVHGDRPVQWKTAAGERQLPPGHSVQLFLTPPAAGPGAALAGEGVRIEPTGQGVRCSAETAGGSLQYSGARMQLRAGETLLLDPILGDLAGPPAPAAPRQQQP